MLREERLRELGEEVRLMRKELHMTQEELAEELGTDFRVLSRYENGQAEMGALMYRRLKQLHEQRTGSSDLLRRIGSLSPENRHAIGIIVNGLRQTSTQQ